MLIPLSWKKAEVAEKSIFQSPVRPVAELSVLTEVIIWLIWVTVREAVLVRKVWRCVAVIPPNCAKVEVAEIFIFQSPVRPVAAAGMAPGHDRVFVLGGFNGHGMGWGPGLATAIAHRILGFGSELDAAFDPSRGALSPRVVPR